VEDAVLDGLGIDGERQDSKEGWDWTLQVGSAPIGIGLHRNDLLDVASAADQLDDDMAQEFGADDPLLPHPCRAMAAHPCAGVPHAGLLAL
jgi:hypothetical protein